MQKPIKILWDIQAKADLKLIFEFIKLKSLQGAKNVIRDIVAQSKNIHFVEQYQVDDFTNMALWNRWKQYDNYDIFNVYGHTPRSEVKITDFDCNVDLGCCYKEHKRVLNPRLCALEFPSMKIYTQENKEIYDE